MAHDALFATIESEPLRGLFAEGWDDDYYSAVEAQFAVCDSLHAMGEDIPSAWQFSPSPLAATSLKDVGSDEDYLPAEVARLVLAEAVLPDELRQAGDVLAQIATLSRRDDD